MRLICMYPYEKAQQSNVKSNFAPIPRSIRKLNWVSDIQLRKTDRKQKLIGTNKPIVPPNTDIFIGNIVDDGNTLRIPLCKTIIAPKSVDSEYIKKYQCTSLQSTNPQEYTKKWLSLGCPYSIDGNILNSLQPSRFEDIIPLRTTEIPSYTSYVQKNATDIPITRKTYQTTQGK